MISKERWVNTAEAAEHVGLAVSTMEKLRVQSGGCVYSKRGRSVRYRISDLDDWMAAQLIHSTSQRAA